jgi:hypothetical protein
MEDPTGDNHENSSVRSRPLTVAAPPSEEVHASIEAALLALADRHDRDRRCLEGPGSGIGRPLLSE